MPCSISWGPFLDARICRLLTANEYTSISIQYMFHSHLAKHLVFCCIVSTRVRKSSPSESPLKYSCLDCVPWPSLTFTFRCVSERPGNLPREGKSLSRSHGVLRCLRAHRKSSPRTGQNPMSLYQTHEQDSGARGRPFGNISESSNGTLMFLQQIGFETSKSLPRRCSEVIDC